MGCGISKFPADHEELHRNDLVITDGTPSTKLLLNKGGGGEDDSNKGRNEKKVLESNKRVSEVESQNEKAAVPERSGNKDDEECKEDERRISDFEGSLWIGSPSFREYCTIDSDSEAGFKDDGSSGGEKKETKINGSKCNASPKPNELGSMTESTEKGWKGRRHKKVVPVGRPSAMRNLLHATKFYNPKVSASRATPAKPDEKTI